VPQRLLDPLADLLGAIVQRKIGAHRHWPAGVEAILWPVGAGDDRLIDHHAGVVAILRQQLADRLDRLGLDFDR
jgi:hypothetical protein